MLARRNSMQGIVGRAQRWLKNMYAVNVGHVGRHFKVQRRQSQRYLRLLKEHGVIYKRYVRDGVAYYSLKKGKEIK